MVRRNRHIVTSTESKILLALIAGCVISQPGCSRLAAPGAGHAPVVASRRFLSADEAAELAARLANDQCEHLYRKRPFRAEQHSAVFQDGMYHWGGLDIGGPGGFSALVTFHQDGSDPHVEVYFSDAK